ncbi:MAG: DUF1275 domain-containing protein [Proteobacteria bacterium]|nr:DUF1275 domain-containing protein [Pseudomonadota bacterium]
MKAGAAGHDSLPMLLLLCLAAGHVDVTGYVQQKVFAANMTGNTVLAVMSLAARDWAGAIERGATLLAFFAGAAASALLMRWRRGQSGRLSLWVEVALLATACVLDPTRPAWLGLVTAAMGVQATVLVRHGQTSVSTVVVTNTIARLAPLMVAGLGGAAAQRRSEAGLLGLSWAAYAAGALAGALPAPLGHWALVPGAAMVLAATLMPRR